MTELTRAENGELDFHVNAIRAAMFRFGLTAGEHLFEIHAKRLYRLHGSFDEFVWQTFHFHAKRAYQFIRAYKVLRILQEAGVARLPEKESHCRPLYRLIDRPRELVRVWKGKKSTIVESERPYTLIENDYFPTPPAVIRDLFVREKFSGSLWDCAAGDGRILRVARQFYPRAKIAGTDIASGTDFLTVQGMTADNVITNPPYTLKDEFVCRALELSRRAVAMLLPLDFLSGQERYRTVFARPSLSLVTVWVYVRRIQFIEGTKPDFPLAWFVWRRKAKAHPIIKWIA